MLTVNLITPAVMYEQECLYKVLRRKLTNLSDDLKYDRLTNVSVFYTVRTHCKVKNLKNHIYNTKMLIN